VYVTELGREFPQKYRTRRLSGAVSAILNDGVLEEMADTEVSPLSCRIKRFLRMWRVGLCPDRRHVGRNSTCGAIFGDLR